MTIGGISRVAALAAILMTGNPATSQAAGNGEARRPAPGSAAARPAQGEGVASHPYVGMWVTADGRVRHELLPDGRYDEARGDRRSAYQGRYRVTGNHVEYWDDTGFTADGTFVSEDELRHGGMVLFRRR